MARGVSSRDWQGKVTGSPISATSIPAATTTAQVMPIPKVIPATMLGVLLDGIYITDARGVTFKVNKLYERLTGLGCEELMECGVFNIAWNPKIVATGEPVTRVQTNVHNRRIVLT